MKWVAAVFLSLVVLAGLLWWFVLYPINKMLAAEMERDIAGQHQLQRTHIAVDLDEPKGYAWTRKVRAAGVFLDIDYAQISLEAIAPFYEKACPMLQETNPVTDRIASLFEAAAIAEATAIEAAVRSAVRQLPDEERNRIETADPLQVPTSYLDYQGFAQDEPVHSLRIFRRRCKLFHINTTYGNPFAAIERQWLQNAQCVTGLDPYKGELLGRIFWLQHGAAADKTFYARCSEDLTRTVLDVSTGEVWERN